jgi:hypothetical protein
MHLAAAPPTPRQFWPHVPPSLERVMVQMLAKEPDGRPSLEQVRQVFESSRRSLTPGMGVPRGPRAAPQRRTMTWIAAAAALAMSGTGAWLLVRRPLELAQPAPPRVTETHQTVVHAPPREATVAPTKTASALPPQPQPPVQPPGVGAVGEQLSDVTAGAPGATAAREGRATLVVHAPLNAHVRVDGQSHPVRGTTLRIDVAGGEHRVVVTAPGHARFDQKVRVAPGAAAEVDATQPWKAATPATAGKPVLAAPGAGEPAAPAAKPDEAPGPTTNPSGGAAPPAAEPSEPAPARAGDQPPSPSPASKKPAKDSPAKDPKDSNYTLDPFK